MCVYYIRDVVYHWVLPPAVVVVAPQVRNKRIKENVYTERTSEVRFEHLAPIYTYLNYITRRQRRLLISSIQFIQKQLNKYIDEIFYIKYMMVNVTYKVWNWNFWKFNWIGAKFILDKCINCNLVLSAIYHHISIYFGNFVPNNWTIMLNYYFAFISTCHYKAKYIQINIVRT